MSQIQKYAFPLYGIFAALILLAAGLQVQAARAQDSGPAVQAAQGPGGLYIAVQPHGGADFTVWNSLADTARISLDLPEGASLAEHRWPQPVAAGEGAGVPYVFPAGSWIAYQITLPENGLSENATAAWTAEIFPRGGNAVQAEAAIPFSGTDETQATFGEWVEGLPGSHLPYRFRGLGPRVLDAQAVMGIVISPEQRDRMSGPVLLTLSGGFQPEGTAFTLEKTKNGFFASAPGTPETAAERASGLFLASLENGEIAGFSWTDSNDRLRVGQGGGTQASMGGDGISFWTAVIFAFIGGLILNIMPCVFPILAIKVFGLVKAGSTSRAALRMDGLAYTIGILASFALLAGLLIALREGGREIGWGYQLQQPGFVFFITILLFAIGLNFLGFFELGSRLTGIGQDMTAKQGPKGSFFTGVLAAIVATPCTAPFMAGAVAVALAQPSAMAMGIFLALGFGLAFPYLLVTIFPAAHKAFPKPGPWMQTFKEFLAFPIFATVVWLLWVFESVTGGTGIILAGAAMVLIGFAVWLATRGGGMLRKGVIATLLLLAFVAGTYEASLYNRGPEEAQAQDVFSITGLDVVRYTPERFAAVRESGQPVFLHFYATWCIYCLVHEHTVFTDDDFQAYLRENDIAFFMIDNTHEDPENLRLMERFGRSSQPLDVYFPEGADREGVALPPVFTTGYVIDKMEEIQAGGE